MSADVAAIKARLARNYWGDAGRPGLVRDRLRAAVADVRVLVAALEQKHRACEGFLEAIGAGALRIDPTPTGRRRLRELAARWKGVPWPK